MSTQDNTTMWRTGLAAGLLVASTGLQAAVPAATPQAVPLPPAATGALATDVVNDAARLDVVAAGAPREAILRAQVLLDRAQFSPGEIDAAYGGNMQAAVSAYQGARGLPVNGTVDVATWAALNADATPALTVYTVSADDVAGPFHAIPAKTEAKAKLKALGFVSPVEGLGEKFHASPALLRELNPAANFANAGEVIRVPNVIGTPAMVGAVKVIVDESDHALTLLDAADKVLARYPASVGSEHDPLPVGNWTIQGIARNPVFHYNPALFWDAAATSKKATLAPGPNNPVGVVWMDLSKEHYGIHGTPEPSKIGKTESHGCIRLTNWSASAVAAAISAGTAVVLQE